MSSFCTAPGNIVYLALSWIKKKCSLQHFGHCSNQYGDVICLFYLLTYLFIYLLYLLPIQEYVLVHSYKQLELRGKKRRPSRLKSLRGLAFQNDAAIATTQSPLQKKEEENIQTPLKQMNDCHRWMPKKNKWICQ